MIFIIKKDLKETLVSLKETKFGAVLFLLDLLSLSKDQPHSEAGPKKCPVVKELAFSTVEGCFCVSLPL